MGVAGHMRVVEVKVKCLGKKQCNTEEDQGERGEGGRKGRELNHSDEWEGSWEYGQDRVKKPG